MLELSEGTRWLDRTRKLPTASFIPESDGKLAYVRGVAQDTVRIRLSASRSPARQTERIIFSFR
jgi:hypothetical protein